MGDQMKKNDIKACIMRVGGTNCDLETQRALNNFGVNCEILHMNELVQNKNLLDYHLLIFPGGFSYGDYVRAGAIWGRRLTTFLSSDLKEFVKEERPILGICNGFQILAEIGLLPKFLNMHQSPQAALTTNLSAKYECRWIHVSNEEKSKCIFTSKAPKVMHIPVAHAEGRFIFAKEEEAKLLRHLTDRKQLVLRYCDKKGNYANGVYPINPNGALYDIAGICDPSGIIFGLMPHPERAFFGWQLPDWTDSKEPPEYGDGKFIFESVIEYLTREF